MPFYNFIYHYLCHGQASRAEAHFAIGQLLLLKGEEYLDEAINILLTAHALICGERRKSRRPYEANNSTTRRENAELLQILKPTLASCYVRKGWQALKNLRSEEEISVENLKNTIRREKWETCILDKSAVLFKGAEVFFKEALR